MHDGRVKTLVIAMKSEQCTWREVRAMCMAAGHMLHDVRVIKSDVSVPLLCCKDSMGVAKQ